MVDDPGRLSDCMSHGFTKLNVLCKHALTDRGPVWDEDSSGLKEHCTDGVTDFTHAFDAAFPKLILLLFKLEGSGILGQLELATKRASVVVACLCN